MTKLGATAADDHVAGLFDERKICSSGNWEFDTFAGQIRLAALPCDIACC
jgi:hypothetical protein